MHRLRHISKYLLQGLIPLIILMYANATINKHYHQISDGEIIVHSHPFSSDSHKHTNKEYKLLTAVGNPDHLILLILIGIALALFSREIMYSHKTNSCYDYIFPELIRNKAPPRFIDLH